MRSPRILAAAVLATSGLVAVGLTTESAQAASSKDLNVTYGGKVVKNEKFTASGRTATHFERQVKLQYKSGSSWKTTKQTTADQDGYFSFTNLTTSKTRTYRYYAGATEGAGKIVGNSKKVSVVSQKVTTATLVNESACHFGTSGSGTSGDVTYYGKFYPPRPGRTVKLVTQTAGTKTLYQDSQGEVATTFNPGNVNGSFTATPTAQATSTGVAAKSGKTLTYKVSTCFIILN